MRNLLPVVFASHRAPPPTSLHGANGAVQSPSGSTDVNAICLTRSPQRAQRRFVDCCAPKNACPCATHCRLYFTLPTSRFRLRMSHAEARRRGGILYFPFSIFHFPFSIFHFPFSIFHFPFSIFHFPFSFGTGSH